MTDRPSGLDPRLSLHQTRPLPMYLSLLVKEQQTGILSATSEDGRREIILVNGEARAARSELEEEKLGLWLVQRELITEQDRSLTLLAQGSANAPPLGHLLVTRNLIVTSRLEKELQELALAIITRAASKPRTYCEFKSGTKEEQPDTLPGITTQQVLLETARAFPDREAKRQMLGETNQHVWTTTDLNTVVMELPLNPTEAFLLSRLDTMRTVADILRSSALPEDQAIDTLFALFNAHVLEIGRPPHPEVSPRQRRATGAPDGLQALDLTNLTDVEVEERAVVQELAREISRTDHYRALGLNPGVSGGDIREAWKAYQQRFDPKRTSEKHLVDCEEALNAVLERAREAYEVLSSPTSRDRYDSVLRQVNAEKSKLDKHPSRGETDPGVRSSIVDANIQRAEELVGEGEVYLAIQLLEQACALEPRPPALLRLAQLLLRNPLWSGRALATLRRAIEVDPGHVDSWVELAEYWRRRNNAERQRKALERALATDPDSERANQMYQQLVGRRELDRLLKRARRRSK